MKHILEVINRDDVSKFFGPFSTREKARRYGIENFPNKLKETHFLHLTPSTK